MILCSCLLLVQWQAPTLAYFSLRATRCGLSRLINYGLKARDDFALDPQFRYVHAHIHHTQTVNTHPNRRTDKKNINVITVISAHFPTCSA